MCTSTTPKTGRADVDPDDLASVAVVSLPLPTPAELPIQTDDAQRQFIVSSANPNLRVTGMMAAPGGQMGFVVGITPSFLRVTRYQGRVILADGYHRAHGFLRRGVTHVPAFINDAASFEDIGFSPGMLSQDALPRRSTAAAARLP
jgi:hypothetical protein